MDETLVPLDYPTAGQITDDELHVLIVKALPDGAKMVHEPNPNPNPNPNLIVKALPDGAKSALLVYSKSSKISCRDHLF